MAGLEGSELVKSKTNARINYALKCQLKITPIELDVETIDKSVIHDIESVLSKENGNIASPRSVWSQGTTLTYCPSNNSPRSELVLPDFSTSSSSSCASLQGTTVSYHPSQSSQDMRNLLTSKVTPQINFDDSYNLAASDNTNSPTLDKSLTITLAEYELLRGSNPLMTPSTGFQVRELDLVDLETENTMLSENILDGYIAMRMSEVNLPSSAYLSTQFMVPKLLRMLPSAVPLATTDGEIIYQVQQGMLRSALMSNPTRLLLTAFRGLHYFLIDISTTLSEITVFDSLAVVDEHEKQIMSTIKHTIVALQMELGLKEWKIKIVDNCPKQTNSYDCGLHIIHSFESFVCKEMDLKDVLTEQDIMDLRGTILSRFYSYRDKMLKAKAVNKVEQLHDDGTLAMDTTTMGEKFVSLNLSIQRIRKNMPQQKSNTMESPPTRATTNNSSSASSKYDVEIPGARFLFITADDMNFIYDETTNLPPNIIEASMQIIISESSIQDCCTLLSIQFVTHKGFKMKNGMYAVKGNGDRYPHFEIQKSELKQPLKSTIFIPCVIDRTYCLVICTPRRNQVSLAYSGLYTETRKIMMAVLCNQITSTFSNHFSTPGWTQLIKKTETAKKDYETGIQMLQDFEETMSKDSLRMDVNSKRIAIYLKLSSVLKSAGRGFIASDRIEERTIAYELTNANHADNISPSIPTIAYPTISLPFTGPNVISNAVNSMQTNPTNEEIEQVRSNTNPTSASRNDHEERLKRIFHAAKQNHLRPDDFMDISILKTVVPVSKNQEKIHAAIRRAAAPIMQDFVTKELSMLHDPHDAARIYGFITHFLCLQKFGKEKLKLHPDLHLPTCKMNNNLQPMQIDLDVLGTNEKISAALPCQNSEKKHYKIVITDLENPSHVPLLIEKNLSVPVMSKKAIGDENVEVLDESISINDRQGRFLYFDADAEDGVETGDQRFTAADVVEIQNLSPEILNYERPDKIILKIPYAIFMKYWDFELKLPLRNSKYATMIDNNLKEYNFPCSFRVWTAYPMSKKSWKKKGFGMATIIGYCKYGRRQGKEVEDPDLACQTIFKCHVKYHPGLDNSRINQNPSELSCSVKINQPEVEIECRLSGSFVLFCRESTSRPITGADRDESRKKLIHDNPLRHRILSHSEVPNLRILHNNFKYASEDVIRKIRSEALNDGSLRRMGLIQAMEKVSADLNSDPKFSDSITAISGFIRHQANIPHITTMYSPQQLRFATNCNEIYLDGTGKVVPPVMNAMGKKTQVLLHMAVGRNSLQDYVGCPVPIFEMLSNKGNVACISQNLMEFVNHVKMVKRSWMPELFVSDFCLSYLHSACISIVGETLDIYINRKFQILMDLSAPDTKTVLFVCSGHFMHANARYLRKRCRKDIAEVALHGFSILVEARTKEEIDEATTNILLLFGSKELQDYRKQELIDYMLNGTLPSDVGNDEEDDPQYDFENVELPVEPRLQREKSKFFVYFSDKRQVMEDRCADSIGEFLLDENDFMSKICLDTFQRWFTYLPLWSKVGFAGKSKYPEDTITTGLVERAIGIFKNSFHTNSNQFEPDLIKDHAELVLNTITDALITGRQAKLGKRKKTMKEDEPKNTTNKSEELAAPGTVSNPAFATSSWGSNKKSKTPINKTFLPRRRNLKKIMSVGAATNKKLFLDRDKIAGSSQGISSKCFIKHMTLLKSEGAQQHQVVVIEETPLDILKQQLNQELGLLDSYWVDQIKPMYNLFRSPIGEGDENDLLTLNGDNMVNSTVADAVAEQLFAQRTETSQLQQLVVSNFIRQVSPQEPYFATDAQFLPSPSAFDTQHGFLYIISFANSHCWLTGLNFQGRKIELYDSLPCYINN